MVWEVVHRVTNSNLRFFLVGSLSTLELAADSDGLAPQIEGIWTSGPVLMLEKLCSFSEGPKGLQHGCGKRELEMIFSFESRPFPRELGGSNLLRSLGHPCCGQCPGGESQGGRRLLYGRRPPTKASLSSTM